MNDFLPKPLQEAQKKGTEIFMREDGEWKLEFKAKADFIEKIVGVPVHIFANNGFGDYLFLKKRPGKAEFDDEAFEFLHEGPEILSVNEELSVLLELKEWPPSSDNYPGAVYGTGEPVQPGDRVRVKVWAEFWKGWQDGVVKYVPGISKRKPQHEYAGLKWVAIRFRRGEIRPLVNPKTGILRKVRFVERGTLD